MTRATRKWIDGVSKGAWTECHVSVPDECHVSMKYKCQVSSMDECHVPSVLWGSWVFECEVWKPLKWYGPKVTCHFDASMLRGSGILGVWSMKTLEVVQARSDVSLWCFGVQEFFECEVWKPLNGYGPEVTCHVNSLMLWGSGVLLMLNPAQLWHSEFMKVVDLSGLLDLRRWKTNLCVFLYFKPKMECSWISSLFSGS